MSNEILKTEIESKAKFFECEVTIRLFGVTVLHWLFPPKK